MISNISEAFANQKDEIKKALIYCTTMLLSVILWCATISFEAYSNRYAIVETRDLHIFLYNKQSGEVWRWYQNVDSKKNEITSEGFTFIHQ